MGKVRDAIDDATAAWLGRQQVFFVATAPLAPTGHVNLSPKGLDTFRVLGPNRVAYLDLTGSGVETIAHIRENERITVMFCAFQGPPRIVRLAGRGHVLVEGDDGFDELAALYDDLPGRRAVIVVDVERVSDSCGYAVPLYSYEGQRERLLDWAVQRGPEGLATYWAEKNATSIDGLPGVPLSASATPGAQP
jgi:hypothetical protein